MAYVMKSGVVSQAATQKQIDFLLKLAGERDLPDIGSCGEERIEAMGALIENATDAGTFDKAKASKWIGELLQRPYAPREEFGDDQSLEPGVYETPGGIFVVKPNRAKTNLYAKKLVEINGQRATEAGTRVAIEFEYAPGAIRSIRSEHRMPVERAKELTLRYGRCINCGRRLKAAVSVERGIGPVCIKAFAGYSN